MWTLWLLELNILLFCCYVIDYFKHFIRSDFRSTFPICIFIWRRNFDQTSILFIYIFFFLSIQFLWFSLAKTTDNLTRIPFPFPYLNPNRANTYCCCTFANVRAGNALEIEVRVQRERTQPTRSSQYHLYLSLPAEIFFLFFFSHLCFSIMIITVITSGL